MWWIIGFILVVSVLLVVLSRKYAKMAEQEWDRKVPLVACEDEARSRVTFYVAVACLFVTACLVAWQVLRR